ncbi:MAG: TadE/TadG family type IV pilus assembly protein [Dehalococcoidia bacterium]
MRTLHIRRHERGQGLVEFAVIFPLFILLLFAMVDGGIVMGRYNNVTNAAKEGARYAAVQTGNDDTAKSRIVDLVKNHAHGALDSDLTTTCGNFYAASADNAICVQWLEGPDGQDPGEVGSYVRVAIRHRQDLMLRILPALGGLGTWEIEGCALQRVERPIDVDGDEDDVDEGCDDFDAL